MISLKKIGSIILSISAVWVLIYSTYFTETLSTFEIPYFEKSEQWVQSLSIDDYGNLSEIDENLELKTQVSQINVFDKIISYWEKAVIEWNNFILDKWIYLINISELNSQYKISWEWFEIDTIWANTIYIDNSWAKTNIFSLNSIVDVQLIDISNKQVVNSIILYPHEYLIFSPNKNRFVKNGDLSLINKVLTFWYFEDGIIKDSKINKTFKELFLSRYNSDKQDSVENLFIYLLKNSKNNLTRLDKFKTGKFGSVFWEKLIQKYNSIFLNDAKRIVYYKNLILRWVWDVINSEKVNNSKNQFLLSSLEDLKEISNEDYLQMVDIVNYYSYLVINNYENTSSAKINFSQITNKLNWDKFVYKNNWNIELSDLYFEYDFYWSNEIFKNISTLSEKLSKTLDNDSKISYFIFYLNKVITSSFKNLENNNLEDILNIFNDYIKISIKYYTNDNSTIIRTWIEEYNEILINLALSLENNYFVENEEDPSLLKLNNDVNINITKVWILEKNIESILKYFDNNKSTLTDKTKDLSIISNYEKSKYLYSKYFLAIKDYDRYTAEYKETNKDFIFWNTLNQSDDDKNSLSISKARDYLSQFKNIDYSKAEINIKDFSYCEFPSEENDKKEIEFPYCYQINNLVIWNSVELDFILHPLNYNNINNFVINWDSSINQWSYKLDNEELVIEEKNRRERDPIEKEKNSFPNFFVNIFNQTEYKQTVKYHEDEVETREESIIVKVFKQNKLLWANWDFSSISDFLNVRYDDLIVEEVWESYSIDIVNSPISINHDKKQFKWLLNSKYEFIPSHSFIEPTFILQSAESETLLKWYKVKFEWNVWVNEIVNYVSGFMNYFKTVSNVSNNLNNIKWFTDIEIIYNPLNNDITYRNNSIKLVTNWEKISSLTYLWNEIRLITSDINRLNIILNSLQ